MASKTAISKPKKAVAVSQGKVKVWPSKQLLRPYINPETRINTTVFADSEQINESLSKAILKLESEGKFLVELMRGGCGTKLDHIHRWDIPEADLIHERAIGFFANGLGFDQAVVDYCWGNIYRKGDYCMPHSHIRAAISIVYVVDEGDHDSEHPIDGKFYICDPRIKAACDYEEHCLTRLIIPDLQPGTMVGFPGQMVHGVNPYNGDRPRITLSWNINREAIPGKPPELR